MVGVSSEKKIVFAIIILYVCFSLFNYSLIDEDAFIFFRCVEDVISGYGYSFNPGEKIEACSSLTWFFLLCLFRALDFNLLTTSKILGIVCGCLSIFLIFKITKKFTDKLPWTILPAFLTIVHPSFILRNQMGLETALYTLVLLWLIFICLEKKLFKYWPLVSLLLVVTRPEGIFLLLGILPVFYIYKEKRGEIILQAIGFFLVLFLIMIARFFYFHDFVPSPFYTKIYPQKLIVGLHYLHSFFKLNYIYYFLIPVVFATFTQSWNKKRIILLWFIIVFFAWVALAGADYKPLFRHCLPVIPLIYIYSITVIEESIGDIYLRKKMIAGSYVLCFSLATFLFSTSHTLFSFPFKVAAPNPITYNLKTFMKIPHEYFELLIGRMSKPEKFNHINYSKGILLGEFIKRNYFKGTTLVYDQMGQAPYTAGIDYFFIDSWGLVDKQIGHFCFRIRSKNSPILRFYDTVSANIIRKFFPETEFFNTKGEVLDYIFSYNPDIIMITTIVLYQTDRMPYCLLTDKRLRDNYQLKYSMRKNRILLFEKRGLNKKPLSIPETLPVSRGSEILTGVKNKLLLKLLKNKG